jgi:hypothetical protein
MYMSCFVRAGYSSAQGSHHSTEAATLNLFDVVQNEVDFELVPIANGMGTVAVREDLTIPLCMPDVRQLVFDECWYRDSPTNFSNINCEY